MSPLAARLLDHAARVMPLTRRDWIAAMRAELAYIPAPLAAAAFALGCVRASYTQRILQMLTVARLARWALALYAVTCAGCYLLATALTGAIKANPDIRPEHLGSDPGTAQALVFHQTYPTWQLAAFVAIAGLLVVGGVMLVRKKRNALPVLGAGVGAASLLAVLDRLQYGAGEWPLSWSAPWIFPLLCLGAVWWLSRRAPDLVTTP